eukprot:scaffold1555_cov173-Amphora_coffeaeformis.AAC.6
MRTQVQAINNPRIPFPPVTDPGASLRIYKNLGNIISFPLVRHDDTENIDLEIFAVVQFQQIGLKNIVVSYLFLTIEFAKVVYEDPPSVFV